MGTRPFGTVEGLEPLLARFTLTELIGTGGTAEVYRATDSANGELVALKIFQLPAGAADADPGSVPADVAHLRHPGLVAVRELGHCGGRSYVVMTLVEGPSLAGRLALGPLPLAGVLRLGTRIAGGLAHVHRHGIVHRDVKPSNILLDATGAARLTDFGVSRFVDATRVTASGVAVGTPAYMAPEQVRGETVGPAADVYALGLVLLEALTGRREYPGGLVESAVARLHRAPRVPPRLPTPLRSLISAMTETDPAHRPTAAEVAARLAGPRAGRPARHRRDAPTRRRAVPILTGAVATVAGAGIVAAGVLSVLTPDAAPAAVAEPINAPTGTPMPVTVPVAAANAASAAATPAPVTAQVADGAEVADVAEVAGIAQAGTTPAPRADSGTERGEERAGNGRRPQDDRQGRGRDR